MPWPRPGRSGAWGGGVAGNPQSKSKKKQPITETKKKPSKNFEQQRIKRVFAYSPRLLPPPSSHPPTHPPTPPPSHILLPPRCFSAEHTHTPAAKTPHPLLVNPPFALLSFSPSFLHSFSPPPPPTSFHPPLKPSTHNEARNKARKKTNDTQHSLSPTPHRASPLPPSDCVCFGLPHHLPFSLKQTQKKIQHPHPSQLSKRERGREVRGSGRVSPRRPSPPSPVITPLPSPRPGWPSPLRCQSHRRRCRACYRTVPTMRRTRFRI